MLCNFELEALARRAYSLAALDESHSLQACEALWRGVVHCRRVIAHRELRDEARAAATRSFLDGVDLSFLKPPPDYLAGMTFSHGLLGPPEE
jgi:hypothetical protein